MLIKNIFKFLNESREFFKLNNIISNHFSDGKHTRSFQYVSDLVDGLVMLMDSNYTQPVNLGNPQEHTIQGR